MLPLVIITGLLALASGKPCGKYFFDINPVITTHKKAWLPIRNLFELWENPAHKYTDSLVWTFTDFVITYVMNVNGHHIALLIDKS